ncbi:hypothetical protein [Citricoccus sp. GCM10030269]|uniref:hypothetical protein n=1 Tax=Citricoccus sp. GCM10030269 TaxID=3273388 RepID=UPI00360C6448
MMGNNAKWAAALAAGYLLGRTKRMKLVLAVGSGMVFQQFRSSSNKTLGPVLKQLQDSPEFKQATEKLTSGLTDAAKGAALAPATKGIEALSNNLQERTERLRRSNAPSGETEADQPADGEQSPDATGDAGEHADSGQNADSGEDADGGQKQDGGGRDE